MKDNIARTKEDFDLGILKGKTVFPFGYPGKKNMTMNTPIGTVPYPIEVYGLTNNKITDYKIMQPGQNALVDGDTIIEKKINKMNKMNYQEGGDMADIVDLTMDENGNKLTFSQAFSKAKQKGLSSFIWEGDSYDTGIKEDMKVTEVADADEMEDMEDMETMEDELPMQQMMPEAKKGMNIQSKFYGKNWPVGDELSGNTQPYQYFDNKRHYKTRGNYPLTGDEFLDKAMMYGQRGLNLPKAQQMGDVSFLGKAMGSVNKTIKNAEDLYKKDRINYFSNRDYENMPYKQLEDIKNVMSSTGLSRNPNFEYFKYSPKMSMEDKEALRSTFVRRKKEKEQQELNQQIRERQQREQAQSIRDAFMDRVEEFKKPRPRQFYNVPTEKPNNPFRGKGPGHGNLPSINRQDGGYTDMVYPTLMDEAKALVRMGRDYDYDYGLHEIGGYRDGGKLPKWLYEARGRAMKKNMGHGGMMHAQEGIDYRAAMIPAEQTGMRPSLNFVPPPTASYNVNPIWNREVGYDLLIHPTLGSREVPVMQKMINQHNNYMDKYGYLLDDDDYLGRLQYEKGMRDALKEKQRYERAYDNYAKGKRKPRKFKKNGGMMSKYKKGDVIQYKKGGRIMTGVVDGYTNDGRIRLK